MDSSDNVNRARNEWKRVICLVRLLPENQGGSQNCDQRSVLGAWILWPGSPASVFFPLPARVVQISPVRAIRAIDRGRGLLHNASSTWIWTQRVTVGKAPVVEVRNRL